MNSEPGQAVRRRRQRARRVAAPHALGLGEEAAGGDRVLDRQDRRQRLVDHADRGGGGARLLLGLGEHPGDRLAVKADLVGEQRLVVARRPDVVLARDVGRGEQREHARAGERLARPRSRRTRACTCCAATGQACTTRARSPTRSSTYLAAPVTCCAAASWLERAPDRAAHRSTHPRRLGEELLEQAADHRAPIGGAAAVVVDRAAERARARRRSPRRSRDSRAGRRPAPRRRARGSASRRRRRRRGAAARRADRR